MSGHSKWSTIKRQKGAADAKRGQVFTKLGREIAVAAREGADPTANSRLKLAVQRARDANMPLDTVERAIKRGAGGGDAANFQEVSYEGYGPSGVAILVDALTDNRNRSAAEIRSVFTRNGGNLGELGSVRWLFDEKGLVTVHADAADPDDIVLAAIDAGAEDVRTDDGMIEIFTEPSRLEAIRTALEAGAIKVISSEVSLIPKMTITVDEEAAQRTIRLIDRLEELDDVQRVYSNVEFSDEVAATLAG
ncbi:MAG: YebC/PmpR family DNA-binding transcriptional regulator [Chloroflexota bacterium]